MLNILVKAPVKIIATFFVSLGLLLGGFLYFPDGLTTLQNWANYISDYVRDWPPQSTPEALFLWRTVTDNNAILAVFVTIFSRSLVELTAQTFGALFKAFR